MYVRAGNKSHKGTSKVFGAFLTLNRDPRAPFMEATHDRRHSGSGRPVVGQEIDTVTDFHYLTFSFRVRVLFQKAEQKFAGIGPGSSPAGFPAFESGECQIEKMLPKKGHRFGLRESLGLTPENK